MTVMMATMITPELRDPSPHSCAVAGVVVVWRPVASGTGHFFVLVLAQPDHFSSSFTPAPLLAAE